MDNLPIRKVLLVEDNMGDADLVMAYLEGPDGRPEYEIVHVTTITAAEQSLASDPPDIALLDLRLPDAVGVATVVAVRDCLPDLPIVVLTGIDDEEVALDCIASGAQDYLCKSDLQPLSLRRTMRFAVARARESETRETNAFTRLVMETGTPAEADDRHRKGLVSLVPLRERRPEDFELFVDRYQAIVRHYVNQGADERRGPDPEFTGFVANLTNVAAGTRDLVEIHTRAIEKLSARRGGEGRPIQAAEARYLALEMVVALTETYRATGPRAD